MVVARDLQERIGFYELGRNEGSFNRLARFVARTVDGGLEKFYDKLGATPALGKFFSSSDRVRHARNAQADHWIRVFEDGLDQAYHERALTIGNTHARIGLEPKWYIGGYALILEHMIEAMVLRGAGRFSPARRRMAKDLVALVKVSMIDMDIALSTYFEMAEKTTRDIVLGKMGVSLRALAEGDLSTRMSDLPESFRQVEDDFNKALERPSATIGLVADSSSHIATSTDEIRAATENLASRTERQANNVQDCARAIDELSSGLNKTSRSMADLRVSAHDTESEATQGREAVREAISAMDDAQQSAQEVVQIAEIIDGIAFQTNLLALNAGVEAARVGEMGRGFAVVANEVRALAQRSSEAADNIKKLLSASREQVDRGAELVKGTGVMLHAIIGKVTEISTGVVEAAQLTEEQAAYALKVNQAISEIDLATQQNAAMVEQSAAATRSMATTSGRLATAVAVFSGHHSHQVPELRRVA
ncbi:methyl-accepting chemotaxis protein [Novosphingobium sp. ES2-1]|uniref:methyl-accepting chemotaxis protein n=1 Tax=Novosphingobium sp. ES2-1 TaxID=2780074 RepID=UPI001880F980|nr:methyl-accepting chemotaxis protein [Novosphingobium sp. ES2-1]QOV95588.1 globin-coupled sensor protein [Novosphingobium sp. ES2-1]